MKKSLIALAVAGVVSAPAFAATANVDVYGKMHVSVSSIDADTANVPTDTSISSNASRIGFKGAEDLGGGLAAIWQYETTINLDGNNAGNGGTGSMRNSFIGVKGGFGTVFAGIHDTPMKLLGRMLDNFGDTLADSRGILGATSLNGTNIFDPRTNNTITYVSPDFSGLSVSGAYMTDMNEASNVVDNNDNDAYSVNAVYKNGPILLGAAYEKQNVTATTDRDMWRLAAGYTFGNAKLGALYQSSESTNAATEERDGWGVFGSYAMGAITLKANYLKAGESNLAAGDDGANQWTAGVDYALSKRTTVYALYARVSNDSNAVYGLGTGVGSTDRVSGGGTAISGGADPSLFGIGMTHTF